MFVTCVYDLAGSSVLCDLEKLGLIDANLTVLLFVK